jgi:hypothetical protein
MMVCRVTVVAQGCKGCVTIVVVYLLARELIYDPSRLFKNPFTLAPLHLVLSSQGDGGTITNVCWLVVQAVAMASEVRL